MSQPTRLTTTQTDEASTEGATRWVGHAHVYGDAIDTDVLYPGRHLAVTSTEEMASHAAEDLDPEFRTRVQRGDVFIAGRSLGCGSSREQAAVALKAAGIRAIVCANAARIYFRNCINNGLPVLRVGDQQAEAIRTAIQTGDPVVIDLANGTLHHPATEQTWQAAPLPPFLQELLADGGLLPHLRRTLGTDRDSPTVTQDPEPTTPSGTDGPTQTGTPAPRPTNS